MLKKGVSMLLIRNGRVVDPVTRVDGCMDICIDGDRIVAVGRGIEPADGDVQVIDATGLVVAPGLMDAHVHFRDPGFTYKEDMFTGSRAALKGGFTTVVCMANTKPVVDNVETLGYIREKAGMTRLHVLQASSLTKGLKGGELVDMELMAENGAAGFTDDGIPVMDEKLLVEGMERAHRLKLPISLHEEDPAFIKSPGVHEGDVSEKLGLGGASRTAEDVMVARDCMLALHTGASVCIQHISSRNSVELVRLAKRLGADVHAEATPHHFTLTDEAVLRYGTNARMNPPLRTENDRQGIIEGLKDGTIDMIVTDHAPHSAEEKAKPIEAAPSGIIGLETSLALGIRSLVEPGHITLMRLMELMSRNPALFYGLTPGSISVGAVADLVIFGEDETWVAGNFASKASNSPFAGWELPGRVHYTICSGEIAYCAADEGRRTFYGVLGETSLFSQYPFMEQEDFLCCRDLYIPAEWSGNDVETLKRACEFAIDAHRGQVRKGTETPYIVHPVETAAIAMEQTDDIDIIVGSLLHDVVEDTSITLEKIGECFGNSVARLVQCESEDKKKGENPGQTWKYRKTSFISKLSDTTRDCKIITLSDKLSNLRAMQRDYDRLGEALWDRFNQKDKKEHGWYYGAVLRELGCLAETRGYAEYKRLYGRIFEVGD